MKLLLDKFREVWGSATDMERRVLGLAFEIDIDEHGWSVAEYTLTDLLEKLGYARSGPALTKLKAIFSKFEAIGLMSSYPPRGKRRRLWFGYVVPETSNMPFQQFFKVISDHITHQETPEKSDLGSLPGASEGDKSDLRSPAEKWKVILDHLGTQETDSQEVILDRILAALDLDDDQTSISTHEESDHQINAAAIEQALASAGIKGSFTKTALAKITEKHLSHDDVMLIISNAKAGKRLKDDKGHVRVRNVPGYVLKCLGTSKPGEITTNFIDEETALKAVAQTPKAAPPPEEVRPGLEAVVAALGRKLTKDEAVMLLDAQAGAPNAWFHIEDALKETSGRNVDNFVEYTIGILRNWEKKFQETGQVPVRKVANTVKDFKTVQPGDIPVKPMGFTPEEVFARFRALETS